MTSTEPIRLRPMSQSEQEAVDMHDDGKPWDEITALTGLGESEIIATLELRNRFASSIGMPTTPAPQPLTGVTRDPDADVDEEADVDWGEVHLVEEPDIELLEEPAVDQASPAEEPVTAEETTPTVDGVAALLDAAIASPQPRAQQLAAEISAGIGELRTILANDNKARVLLAARDVLAHELAKTEAELAELLGAADDAVEATAAVSTTAAAPEPGKQEPAQLAFDPNVRAWAKSHGWEVGDRGRMSAAVVNAYLAR